MKDRLFGRTVARVVTEEEMEAVAGGKASAAGCTGTDGGRDSQCDEDVPPKMED